VLQLERRGIDVGVEPSLANEYGRHRTVEDLGEVGTLLVVTRDEYVDDVAARPGMRMIADWYALPPDQIEELAAERERVAADLAAGRLSYEEATRIDTPLVREMTNDEQSTAWRAAVFVDERIGQPASAPG
jgi:hypothetical protein